MKAGMICVFLLAASFPVQAKILHLSLESGSQTSEISHQQSAFKTQEARFSRVSLKDHPPQLLPLIQRIAFEERVPPRLLESIVSVESGFHPWTLNVEGKAHFFDSHSRAEDFLRETLQKGIKNVDAGLTQINVYWHGHHFKNPSELLSPEVSLRYAAKLLSAHAQKARSWIKAALLYHSGDKVHQSIYRKRLLHSLSERNRT